MRTEFQIGAARFRPADDTVRCQDRYIQLTPTESKNCSTVMLYHALHALRLLLPSAQAGDMLAACLAEDAAKRPV